MGEGGVRERVRVRVRGGRRGGVRTAHPMGCFVDPTGVISFEKSGTDSHYKAP